MKRWNRLALIALVFAACAPALHAQSRKDNAQARALFLEGRNLWDDGAFAAAEKKFREALTRYPDADQSDRTAYYLITTLIKQGRAAEALAQIEEFSTRFPRSAWRSDVEEKRIALVGIPLRARPATPFQYFPPEFEITKRIITGELTVHLNELRSQIERAFNIYDSVHPFMMASEAPLRHEILRILIEKNPDYGITVAQERLKVNPYDPAVVLNLSTIAHSNSEKALFFIAEIATSDSPSAQNQAIYWLSRSSVDKQALVRALEGLLTDASKKNGASVAAMALARLSADDQQTVLAQLLRSDGGVSHLESIYRNSTVAQLRGQIISMVRSVPGNAAFSMLSLAARNERDPSVRRSAQQALSQRAENRR